MEVHQIQNELSLLEFKSILIDFVETFFWFTSEHIQNVYIKI